MNRHRRFADAAAALKSLTEPPGGLCAPFVTAFPIARAAISTLGDPFGIETLYASDPEAARLDELQIDLGEGPCWEALATQRPVIESDLLALPQAWPVLAEAAAGSSLRAVHAFPLSVGSLRIGAIDLYSDRIGAFTEEEIGEASSLADIAASHVLRRALAHRSTDDGELLGGSYSRREVHQATGMVTAQLGVTVDNALLIIRGHAYATGTPVREIAGDIVAGRLEFG